MGTGSQNTTKPTGLMRRTLQEEVLRMLDRQKKEWDLAARIYYSQSIGQLFRRFVMVCNNYINLKTV